MISKNVHMFVPTGKVQMIVNHSQYVHNDFLWLWGTPAEPLALFQ